MANDTLWIKELTPALKIAVKTFEAAGEGRSSIIYLLQHPKGELLIKADDVQALMALRHGPG